MALIDEDLPAVQRPQSMPQDIDVQKLLEFTDMNGVNAGLDALVSSGVSPVDAAKLLLDAGYSLPDAAAPEQVAGGGGGYQPQGAAPQVRRADPVIKPTGAIMDTSFIDQLNSAQSQEEFNKMYDALPKVQQHIYDRSYMQDIDPAWAAEQAQEFYNEQARINDPKYQAQLKADTARADALSGQALNSAQQAADTSDRLLKIMDRLRGGPREGKGAVAIGEEAYRGRVGPFDSSVPNALSFSGGKREGWYTDFKALQDTLGLAEARLNKGQGNMTETERFMLRDAATGGLDYRRDDDSFAVIFEDMYSMLQQQSERNKAALANKQGTQQSVAPSPAAPAAASPAAPAPAPTPQAGFQVGKPYLDAKGRQRIFRGYSQDGRPLFSQ